MHDRHPVFSFHLLTHFLCLGRQPGIADFWRALRPLAQAMTLLHHEGVVVP